MLGESLHIYAIEVQCGVTLALAILLKLIA